MNKEEQELLNNPLVKKIASDFARTAMQKFTDANQFGAWKGNDAEWDDLILSHVKSQQPSKEWEVVAYIYRGEIVYRAELDKGENAMFANTNYTLYENFLIDLGAPIHAVRRLSDGEVFTIGDEVYFFNGEQMEPEVNSWIIDHFFIREKDGQLLARSKSHFEVEYIDNFLFKVKAKRPLFTTEDGKEIFEGEIYYEISENYELRQSVASGFKVSEKHTKNYFSTKEKAEEWVLINRPCLSVKDLTGPIFTHGELIKLAKSKLK